VNNPYSPPVAHLAMPGANVAFRRNLALGTLVLAAIWALFEWARWTPDQAASTAVGITLGTLVAFSINTRLDALARARRWLFAWACMIVVAYFLFLIFTLRQFHELGSPRTKEFVMSAAARGLSDPQTDRFFATITRWMWVDVLIMIPSIFLGGPLAIKANAAEQ
jgi:uncharacterized membrane protein